MPPPSTDRHREFLRCFTANEAAIRAYVRRLVPLRSDADDVMQEVAVVLWEKFDEFREGGRFSGLGVGSRPVRSAGLAARQGPRPAGAGTGRRGTAGGRDAAGRAASVPPARGPGIVPARTRRAAAQVALGRLCSRVLACRRSRRKVAARWPGSTSGCTACGDCCSIAPSVNSLRRSHDDHPA